MDGKVGRKGGANNESGSWARQEYGKVARRLLGCFELIIVACSAFAFGTRTNESPLNEKARQCIRRAVVSAVREDPDFREIVQEEIEGYGANDETEDLRAAIFSFEP